MIDLNKRLTELVSYSGALQEKIDTAKQIDTKRKKLVEEYYELNRKYEFLNTRFNNLKSLNSMVMRILDHRRDKLFASVIERTEAILSLILPEENFKVNITFSPRGKDYVSEVFVGKDNGSGVITWGRPKGTNGEFMKQLISFSLLASINSLLGSKFIYMDEPFSSSDSVNVGKMKPIIELMLDQGLQLLFIEHKKELYEGLPHNIVRIYKHRSPTDEHEGYVEVLQNEMVVPSYENSMSGQPVGDTAAGSGIH